ncbi:hypothetical protein CLU79DRAFT_729286 [Phycomyces nitens]|nr:hypothetical protein CLU79DRAFT_729286 [Phycomyces nitens]
MSQYMSFKPHNPNKLSKTRTPKSIAKESFSLSRVNQKIQPRPSSQNNKSELNQAVLSSVSALGNMSQYMSLKPHNPNKPRKTRTPKSIAKKSFSLPRVNQKIQPRPSSQNTKSELNQAVLSSVSDVGNMSQYMSFKLNNPNMPGKTRTPKSIAKKSFSLPRVNQKIQPRPSSQNNKSELNKAVLSSLSALRTKIDQSHILIQQIHKHIQSLSTENTVEKPAPPPAPPSVGMYFNYRIPLVSSLIRARTREVLTETPLTITEGPLSESNRPITDMVENYIQQLPEKKALMSVIVEQKTRRHLAYKLNRAKTSTELLEKRNQASRRRSRKIRVIKIYFLCCYL